MIDTLARWIRGVDARLERRGLRNVLTAIYDRYSSQPLSTATLAITAGGSATASTGAVYQGVVKGVPVTIASGTVMPVLTGTITANKFNVYCFFIDSVSTVTVAQGTEGTTIGAVLWPAFPENKALVGILLITHSATFTGNTTPLDTATTVYLSPVGPFDPSVLL